MNATGTASMPSESDVLSQARSENFPVALRVLGRRERRHLIALYGYARLVDDLGDELEGGFEARLAALDAAETELDRAFAGTATHPVFCRLAEAITTCGLSRALLGDLIEANRLDQAVTSYDTFDQLLGYCRLSANPVGRLVLTIFGQAGPEREALSDQICSALQIIEHLQDVVEDASNGRVYLPAEEMAHFGVSPSLLREPVLPAPAAFRRLVAMEAARAHEMLGAGSRLVSLLSGRAGLAIAGFAGGGLAQLEALERAGFDVLSGQVKAPSRSVARHGLRLALGSWQASRR